MLEDIIHGPKSSNEGIEKIQTFGPPLDPKGRAATFLSKLKAQARRVCLFCLSLNRFACDIKQKG